MRAKDLKPNTDYALVSGWRSTDWRSGLGEAVKATTLSEIAPRYSSVRWRRSGNKDHVDAVVLRRRWDRGKYVEASVVEDVRLADLRCTWDEWETILEDERKRTEKRIADLEAKEKRSKEWNARCRAAGLPWNQDPNILLINGANRFKILEAIESGQITLKEKENA